MNRRLVFLGAGGLLVLGAVAAAVGTALAQPTYPDPNEVTLTPQPNNGQCTRCTTIQAQEPDGGFTGACLFTSMTYQPQLPLVCYSPSDHTANYGPDAGATTVAFPAADVARSYAKSPGNYDSYEVLGTCYPHNADGSCPQWSSSVSQSCCDYGANMISLDGKTATGTAFFQ
jgi:hypothetical protein